MSNAVATESSLNATILAAGYAAVSIPRAGRLPSDIATLAACDPMTETLRHMGGQARVDAAHAHNIRTPSSPCWRAAELTPNHH